MAKVWSAAAVSPAAPFPPPSSPSARRTRKRQNFARDLAQQLRRHEIPIIARISEDVLLLDPRTVFPEEDKIVVAALRSLKIEG